MNYRLQCTCGHSLYRPASSREEAVEKFKAVETEAAVDQHFAAYHKAGEPKPTLAQLHGMIDQFVAPAEDGLSLKYPALTTT